MNFEIKIHQDKLTIKLIYLFNPYQATALGIKCLWQHIINISYNS